MTRSYAAINNRQNRRPRKQRPENAMRLTKHSEHLKTQPVIGNRRAFDAARSTRGYDFCNVRCKKCNERGKE